MKRNIGYALALTVLAVCISGCMSSGAEVKQWGLEDNDTITLNLTRDPNVGMIFITHVNGEATGASYTPPPSFKKYFMGAQGDFVYVNPFYIKLNGRPIVFTLKVPVFVYGQGVQYRTTELRLTKLSDIKAGDVLTLKWMYQTQTFVFMDSTGNIVQQSVPTFN